MDRLPDARHSYAEYTMDHCPRCGFMTHPDFDEPTTPESRAAWAAFYATPEVVSAQQAYTAREKELQLLRDHYNNEVTRARIEFQAATHAAMFTLTRILQELDVEESIHSDELEG